MENKTDTYALKFKKERGLGEINTQGVNTSGTDGNSLTTMCNWIAELVLGEIWINFYNKYNKYRIWINFYNKYWILVEKYLFDFQILHARLRHYVS